MYREEVIIPKDIFNRTAANLVHQTSQVHMPTVFVEKDGRRANACSLLGLLSLRLLKGEKVSLVSTSKENLNKVLTLFQNIDE